MHTLDAYTGAWQPALRPSAPKVGSMFRCPENPDGREWDDFRRVLDDAGLSYAWVRYMPRLRMDVYRIVRV